MKQICNSALDIKAFKYDLKKMSYVRDFSKLFYLTKYA